MEYVVLGRVSGDDPLNFKPYELHHVDRPSGLRETISPGLSAATRRSDTTGQPRAVKVVLYNGTYFTKSGHYLSDPNRRDCTGKKESYMGRHTNVFRRVPYREERHKGVDLRHDHYHS